MLGTFNDAEDYALPEMGEIADLSTTNFQSFERLCEIYGESRTLLAASLIDLRDRFSLWSNNIGAQQSPLQPTSLQHRVRDAAKLQSLFKTRLRDLQEDLNDCLFGDLEIKSKHS